jgi:hypothetical protein
MTLWLSRSPPITIHSATQKPLGTQTPTESSTLHQMVDYVRVGRGPACPVTGFPEESEKFFTLSEIALINQHLCAPSKNVVK